MPVPQFKPTHVLRETAKEQGYDPGNDLVTIEYSRPYVPVPPLGPFTESDGDGMPTMTESQALQPKGPGDVHPVKYGAYSSDQGM